MELVIGLLVGCIFHKQLKELSEALYSITKKHIQEESKKKDENN